MARGSVDETLAWLVAEVLRRRKYAGLLPEFVASVGRRELEARGDPRAALHATRNKLHQVVGAYRGIRSYPRAAERLARARSRGDLRPACRQLMRAHASTRERLPILERLYRDVFGNLGPVGSVLDLACGLHPLGIPWMPLAADVTYLACDVDQALIGFLGGFFEQAGVRGRAFACDLLHTCPEQEVELAFLLKSLPCLEQLDPSIGPRLLAGLRARYVVVSFPEATLGGRRKGMGAHYERHFRELVSRRAWRIERFVLPGERVFRIEK